jgi:hypothetical protein
MRLRSVMVPDGVAWLRRLSIARKTLAIAQGHQGGGAMKLFVLAGVVFTALLALASPAAAHGTECNGTLTGANVPGDLVVPENGTCKIVDSNVGNDVKVSKNAYFQSTHSSIADDIRAKNAQTVFVESGSTVGDDLTASKTAQVFIFDSTLNGTLEVKGATDKVNICGNTVDGRVSVKDSGTDILVGDPLATGCGGNTVLNKHGIKIERNFVDVELIVRGNTVQGGNLEVNRNAGPAEKHVEGNTGGRELECLDNEQPFAASGNTGWRETEGQCAIPPTECTTPQTGATIEGDLTVPDNESCTIVGSKVGGSVRVGRNSFFQASNSTIAGDVKGRKSLTIFLDQKTTVGGEVDASGAFQVFVFDSSVGNEIDVRGATDKVNICGNQVTRNIEVSSSKRDILVGDSDPTVGCAGNTVGKDIEIQDNWVDVELVVQANTVGDDLTANDNRGPADKSVTGNTGGDRLACWNNESPFTGAPNSGFASTEGQCALI